MSTLVPRQQEKWPGNLHEYKLSLPVPESWQYQSNFRTLSHDNSKAQLCHALKCHSHAHSISIVIAQLHWWCVHKAWTIYNFEVTHRFHSRILILRNDENNVSAVADVTENVKQIFRTLSISISHHTCARVVTTIEALREALRVASSVQPLNFTSQCRSDNIAT